MPDQAGPPRPGEPRVDDRRYANVQGVRVPKMIYGTAWKEEATTRMTRMALAAGFRGIDTANQRRHYFEAGVGEAVREALGSGAVRREELFLQTKFTYAGGQDHRLPYDPGVPLAVQVVQSFSSSLEHLGVDRLDSYLLHGPSTYPGLSDDDWETWTAMEELQRRGETRLLGASNVTIEQLEELHAGARAKPAFVQNRCFARPEADRSVRVFCRERGILYQAFSLLTAKPNLLLDPRLKEIAARTGRTAPEVVFRYALHEGMVVLTGTMSRAHMAHDLEVYGFELRPDEIAVVEGLLA